MIKLDKNSPNEGVTTWTISNVTLKDFEEVRIIVDNKTGETIVRTKDRDNTIDDKQRITTESTASMSRPADEQMFPHDLSTFYWDLLRIWAIDPKDTGGDASR